MQKAVGQQVPTAFFHSVWFYMTSYSMEYPWPLTMASTGIPCLQ